MKSTHTIRFLLAGLTACTLAQTAASAEPAAKRPNLVLIMVDDMGIENLSCYGSEVYQTPHIDALAASGIRFSHAHSQPICTPSRVQSMTGIYNNRNYTRFAHLDPAQITFANLLRDAGYATAIGGKWQLKGDYEGVRNFGFDRHCLWQLNRRPSRYPNPGLEIDGERKDFKNGEFGPDIINAYLRDFIRAHQDKDQPFLVYYPMNLPHWPFVPTPDHPDYDPEMWRDLTEEPRGVFMTQKYWDAFVRYTDKMVANSSPPLRKPASARTPSSSGPLTTAPTLTSFPSSMAVHTRVARAAPRTTAPTSASLPVGPA
jgi:arylsulfatase A